MEMKDSGEDMSVIVEDGVDGGAPGWDLPWAWAVGVLPPGESRFRPCIDDSRW